jgi:hypothetical protein
MAVGLAKRLPLGSRWDGAYRILTQTWSSAGPAGPGSGVHAGSSTSGSVVWVAQALVATSATTTSTIDHHGETPLDRLTLPSS